MDSKNEISADLMLQWPEAQGVTAGTDKTTTGSKFSTDCCAPVRVMALAFLRMNEVTVRVIGAHDRV